MFINKLRLEERNYKDFTLLEPLAYEGRDDRFVVPVGFVTDFATVPQFLYWLIPSYGQYTNAAVVHDWLCVQLEHEYRLEKARKAGVPTIDILFKAPANAVDTDGIFRRIMREEGVPLIRRWLMWTGVRWGAFFSPHRQRGRWRTLPQVLAISALALPFLLLPTIFIGLTLLVDRIVDR